MKTMKIVELGHSGVGKTTYMASMYGALQNRINGFSLKARNSSNHTRLLSLATAIKTNQYPAATEQRSEYDFDLQYQGNNALLFSYADYRGKAIRESSDSEEARLLQRDLSESDGIMLFCDCQALVRGDSRINEIRRMTALVSNALKGLNHPISLAIVLTKVDLVEEFPENLLAPFESLITAIQASNLVKGALIPVACGSEPINVEMPLLFALQTGVRSEVDALNQLIEEYTKSAEYWKKKSQGIVGFGRQLWDSLAGNTTDAEMARREMEKAQEKRQELEPIIQPANALSQYVRQLPLIKAGTSTKEYVKKLSGIKSGISVWKRLGNFLVNLFVG
jgi:GTPase SAR1 family protein